VPGWALVHPVSLLALGVLLLNDHVLKRTHPGWVTGKLSDVAGMIFFPLLLLSMVEWLRWLTGRPPRAPRAAVWGCAALTGAVFASIQLWEPAGEAWAWGLGGLQAPLRGAWRPVPHTADPTDLVALLALWVPVSLAGTSAHRAPPSAPR
jgi:hypothetical protein